MSIFDVFRGPSEQEVNWSANQETNSAVEETGNKAIEFNIGNHPEIQKYLAEKASSEIIGSLASTVEGRSTQRAAMVELTNL